MNWKNIVADLEGAGLTQTAIADLVKCSQPYVSQLKTGARTKVDFEIGHALVALHKERCAKRQRLRAA